MYQKLLSKEKTISVIGLGYVGLPLAIAFAKKFEVIGFDINVARIDDMKKGKDPSNQLSKDDILEKKVFFTADETDLAKAHFHIIAVPTDVDEYKVPDLSAVFAATASVAKVLKKGDYVIYESTVYPGCTEEDCLPVLEKISGLQVGLDFKIGYSPERINPGDKKRRLENILKIVAGGDEASKMEIAKIYGAIITAGIYEAPSIKVAEAAKVIENTQRDLNISLMNELAMIFDRMNIDTQEVLKAAGTKWNFLPFTPGLVGGHCIGVDPYYLVHKAKQLGHDPQVILSGRRINDDMPAFVAKKLVQMLLQMDKNPKDSKVLVMGITFKENVSDIRNSKIVDLVNELLDFSIQVDITDPYASSSEVSAQYNLKLLDRTVGKYDAVLIAVAHDKYKNLIYEDFEKLTKANPIILDLKGIYNFSQPNINYWRL